MLIPNTIPESEPEINVGIILPEDNINRLILIIPDDQTFNIGSSEFILDLAPGSKARIELFNNHYFITTDEDIVEMKGELTIEAEEHVKPSKKSGIRVAPVIAGRGFHWQKKIEVHLPGSLIIRPVDGNLILINKLPLEEYVMCVATSEMGASCPDGLIESQTIAARSWLLANVEQKHIDMGMDVCNDDCCQRYQGTTFLSEQSVLGALNTYGKVLLFEDSICDARYSKSCGGMMEAFENIWPDGKKHPYFKVKADAEHDNQEIDLSEEIQFERWINLVPESFCSSLTIDEKKLPVYLGKVDEQGKYFRWQVTLRQGDLTKSLNMYAGIMAVEIIKIDIIKRGGSGRITRMDIHYFDISNKRCLLEIASEYNVRRFLSDKFLYSSAFIIKPLFETQNDIPDAFILTGAGWGHGVGLCQIGALGMALKDYSTGDILQHYYPGSELKQIY